MDTNTSSTGSGTIAAAGLLSPRIDPQSAAQHVFGLPELLESILLHLLHLSTPPPLEGWCMLPHVPARCLYVLQRVNSVFQATIARNLTMQRAMFLASYPDTEDIEIEMKGMYQEAFFDWALDGISFPEGSFWLYSDDCINPCKKRVEYDICDPILFKKPEASWRKMKLNAVATSKPLHLSFTSAIDGTELGVFRCEDEVTLGKVYDGMLSLLPFLRAYEVACDEYNDARGPQLGAAALPVEWKAVERTGDRLDNECARGGLWK